MVFEDNQNQNILLYIYYFLLFSLKIAKQVCKEINLKFGSIDIIETTSNELLVLEVNSGVMLENYIRLNPNEYVYAKNIYRNAIKNLFKENKKIIN